MNNFKTYLMLFFSLALISSCSEEVIVGGGNNNNNNGQPQTSDWIIPENEVFDGGPGKDGIPSIDNPNYDIPSAINFMSDEDLIVVVENNGDVRGYPHPIMDWHEIVNDKPGEVALAITYCPLTGTAIAWDRLIDGEETTFGVSGLLYNSNLIPYDRATDSNWSQIRQDCVNGDLITSRANQYPVVEMSWATFKEAFPNAKVVNSNTGFNRSYGLYPYGNYKENNSRLLFPVSTEDNSVPQKERVLAVVYATSTKVYRFSSFPESGGIVEDQALINKVVVVANEKENYMVAFHNNAGIEFSYVANSFPVVLKDVDGNTYDVFGRSSTATNLNTAMSFIGYWFSFPAFFEDVEVYE